MSDRDQTREEAKRGAWEADNKHRAHPGVVSGQEAAYKRGFDVGAEWIERNQNARIAELEQRIERLKELVPVCEEPEWFNDAWSSRPQEKACGKCDPCKMARILEDRKP